MVLCYTDCDTIARAESQQHLPLAHKTIGPKASMIGGVFPASLERVHWNTSPEISSPLGHKGINSNYVRVSRDCMEDLMEAVQSLKTTEYTDSSHVRLQSLACSFPVQQKKQPYNTPTLATWRGKGLNGSKARNDSLDVKFPGHSSLTSSRLLEPESKYKR